MSSCIRRPLLTTGTCSLYVPGPTDSRQHPAQSCVQVWPGTQAWHSSLALKPGTQACSCCAGCSSCACEEPPDPGAGRAGHQRPAASSSLAAARQQRARQNPASASGAQLRTACLICLLIRQNTGLDTGLDACCVAQQYLVSKSHSCKSTMQCWSSSGTQQLIRKVLCRALLWSHQPDLLSRQHSSGASSWQSGAQPHPHAGSLPAASQLHGEGSLPAASPAASQLLSQQHADQRQLRPPELASELLQPSSSSSLHRSASASSSGQPQHEARQQRPQSTSSQSPRPSPRQPSSGGRQQLRLQLQQPQRRHMGQQQQPQSPQSGSQRQQSLQHGR